MRKIVVGIDGSENSVRALRWAADEARNRDARLTVVHAWLVPPLAYAGMEVAPVDEELFAEAAEATARSTLQDAVVGTVPAGIEVLVVRGHAGDVLIREGAKSDMIVVGSRGRGAVAGLLLGSTSQQVSRHASVPVVVVPTDATAGALAA